jgi:hypothetical protein
MFAMRNEILPVNRNSVDHYLEYTWRNTSLLTKSLRPPAVNISYQAWSRFDEYVQHEKDRIRKNMEHINYYIDASETVYGVLGPGRIEKVYVFLGSAFVIITRFIQHILTLIYLILRRDLKLLRLATRDKLGQDELAYATFSLARVFDAVDTRYSDLRGE